METLLRYHQDLEHGARKKVCPICGKASTKLYEHMQAAHSAESKFHCDMCEYKGKTKELLKRHKMIHIDPEDRPFRCEVCGKGFLFSDKLKKHLFSHVNIKPYI